MVEISYKVNKILKFGLWVCLQFPWVASVLQHTSCFLLILVDTLSHRRKAWIVFAPTGEERLSEGDKNNAVEIFVLISGALLSFLYCNKRWSYSPASCWNISNEIDWDSLKNSQEVKKKTMRYENHWVLIPETEDRKVTVEFAISERKEQDRKTSGILWRSSLRVLYK